MMNSQFNRRAFIRSAVTDAVKLGQPLSFQPRQASQSDPLSKVQPAAQRTALIARAIRASHAQQS